MDESTDPLELAFRNGGERQTTGVCIQNNILPAEGLWEAWAGTSDETYLSFTLIVFLIQSAIAVLLTRLLIILFTKYLRQTHFVALLLGGLLLGPSCLLAIYYGNGNLFPLKSLLLLDTMGFLGLLYYFFLLGLTMDLNVIKTTIGKMGCLLAAVDIAVTIFVAIFVSMFVTKSKEHHIPSTILGIAASMTGFPVLNRIIIQLRLSNTKMGIMATSCSIVETGFIFLLLPMVNYLSPDPDRDSNPHSNKHIAKNISFVLLADIVVIVLCIYVVRPVIKLVIRKTSPDGVTFGEVFITFIFAFSMFFGFLTNFFGSHVVLGPLVFGLAISYGHLGTTLVGMLEDFVDGILLPLYFVVIGLRTHPFGVWTGDHKKQPVVTMMIHPFFLIFVCASIVKVGLGIVVSKFQKMQITEGIVLGLLLNTKGFIQLIVINYGHDIVGLMDDKSYAYAIYFTLFITGLIPVIIGAIYKPPLQLITYKRRSVQKPKGDPELRILACFHDPRKSVPAIINLLRLCQPTKKNPFSIYALYLLEQTDYHGAATTQSIDRCASSNHTAKSRQPQYDHIVKAFENYQRNLGDDVVDVCALTAKSPYNTMHEEVCKVGDTKGIALVVLPFHKQQTIDGSLEETNASYREINEDIMNNAPCSVAVFVDRGLGGGGGGVVGHHPTIGGNIIVLFLGGPDDREALSLGWRMTENPDVSLTVLHLIPADDTLNVDENTRMNDMGALKSIIDNEKEKQRDEDYINDFKKKAIMGHKQNSRSIIYKEQIVNDVEETMGVIKGIDTIYDLFIVGRGLGRTSCLTEGLIDFSECPELGAIGDLLASPDFAMTTTSVLIVQQYVGATNDGGSSGSGTPNSSNKQYCDLYDNYHNLNRMPSYSDSTANLYHRRV